MNFGYPKWYTIYCIKVELIQDWAFNVYGITSRVHNVILKKICILLCYIKIMANQDCMVGV